MDPVVAKLICLFALLADCLLFGFIPRIIIPPKRQPGESHRHYVSHSKKWYHVSRKYRRLFVSLVGTFGGGVFLATCLLDLLIDVTEDYEEFFEQAGITVDFPMAEFTACVGFFLILFIEQLVLFIRELSQTRDGRLDSTYSRSESTSTMGSISVRESLKRQSSLGSVSGIKIENEEPPNLVTNTVSEDREDNAHPQGSKIRAAILLLALSIHSVFEGLAVGLEPTADKVIQLFSALIIHKSVLAFSLGMSMVQSDMSFRETLLSVCGFALASPVGIAIGIIVSQQQGLFSLGLSTVLQGLATGTFLYITFFEVLPLEFNCRRWRMQKVACLLLGFGVMCFIMILT